MLSPPPPVLLEQPDGREPASRVCPGPMVSVRTTSVGRGPPLTSTASVYVMVSPTETASPEAGLELFEVVTWTMGVSSVASLLSVSGSTTPDRQSVVYATWQD